MTSSYSSASESVNDRRTIQAPSRAGLLKEPFGLLELPRLLVQFPSLARQPRGQGQRVLVLPGFGASDASTAVLRAYVAFLGYRTSGWGLGRNTGEVPVLIEQVVSQLDAMIAAGNAPIRLIGWSLGGYIAREATRERPAAVQQVITLGSPVVGGPKYTTAAATFEQRGVDLDAIEAEVDERNRRPLGAPVTAVYSRNDGVVAWQACIDPYSEAVDHVEVQASHVGLGFSAEVFRIIAERLVNESR